MVTLFIKNKIWLLFFILCAFNAPVWACEGDERAETMILVHKAMVTGYRAGHTMNIQGLFSEIAKIEGHVEKLPPSCQGLYQEVADDFTGRYDPGKTQCIGDVCCGFSSCYARKLK
jgi:hypothetical protein